MPLQMINSNQRRFCGIGDIHESSQVSGYSHRSFDLNRSGQSFWRPTDCEPLTRSEGGVLSIMHTSSLPRLSGLPIGSNQADGCTIGLFILFSRERGTAQC